MFAGELVAPLISIFSEIMLVAIIIRCILACSKYLRSSRTIFMLAFKNLQRRKWRTILTLFSLTVTVAGFISILVVSQYVGFQISSTFTERFVFGGESTGYPYFCDSVVTANHVWWSFERKASLMVHEDVLNDIQSISGVEWAEPYLGDVRIRFTDSGQRRYWYVKHENGTVRSRSSNIFLAGVDPLVEAKRMDKQMLIIQGSSAFNAERSAIVGYDFARSNNITVGDNIVIPTNNLGAEHDVPGAFSTPQSQALWQVFWNYVDNPWKEHFFFSLKEEIELHVVGVFWTSTPYDNFIITNYAGLQKAFGFGESATAILVKFSSGATNDTISRIWSIEDVNVMTPVMMKRFVPGEGVGATFSGVSAMRYSSVSNVQNAVIMEFATAIFIAATVYANVMERRWEIGLLKAVGFRPKFVLAMILAESLIIGLIAGILGFLSANLFPILSRLFNVASVSGIEQKFSLEWGMTAILLAVATSVFSSLIPALHAAMIRPMRAMGRG